MNPENPNVERMNPTSGSPKCHYDQKLCDMREKFLPLLERLVGKFSEYKKICIALKEKRPPLEWLKKLEITCEKIQNKMTAQFFEQLDEAERDAQNKTTNTVEKAKTEIASDIYQEGSRIKSRKRSRWDIKPEDDFQENGNHTPDETISRSRERRISKTMSDSGIRKKFDNRSAVIDLTTNEDIDFVCSQKRTRPKCTNIDDKDPDVEIIASTAGYNPLRRAKSQTQFVTLEEVNKSPFYKKFTSDNMLLDSHAANLKYGTVYDLMKSKAQLGETRHRKNTQRRCDSFPRRPVGGKDSWSIRRDHENKKNHTDSYENKSPLPPEKPHIARLTNENTHEHLQKPVEFVGRGKDSNNVSVESRWFDNSYFKTKQRKTGNEFQGKMPFYKQNIAGNTRYTETPHSSQPPKDPESIPSPNLYPASNKSCFPSSQGIQNTHYNSGFPQQTCSFHCNCCKNPPYYASLGTSYQPTVTCGVGSSNYTFFPGQYFPNQQVISPLNKNLPTPFPTYAVHPLSTPALPVSTPYSNNNKPGYSVPVLCNEGSSTKINTTPSNMTWNTSSDNPTFTTRNIVESRPKDPRSEMLKSRLNHSTSNLTQRFSAAGDTLTQAPCFSGISEKRFSQSCTFLRPDNLYKDFKCHSNENRDDSLESLKSFGLVNNVTTVNVPSNIELPNKPTISESKKCSSNEIALKIHSQKNNSNETSLNLRSAHQTEKQETGNMKDVKTQRLQDYYISPLSNLYNDSSSKSEECRDETTQQMDNRKRKYDEVFLGNVSSTNNKRKNVGKVAPMNKFDYVLSKENLSPKRPFNSEKKSLENHELSQHYSSPRNDDANLSPELWEKIKSPTELSDKDHELDYTLNTNENYSKTYEPHVTELQNSKRLPETNKLISQKQNLFGKESVMEKDTKQQKPKKYDTRNNYSKSYKNKNLLESQKLGEKDKLTQKQKNMSSKKSNTKKVELISSQPEDGISCSQKEKPFKAKNIEKISSSESVTKNTEPNTNPTVQLFSLENTPVSRRRKPDNKEKLSEKNVMKKAVNDKSKFTNTQRSQKDKSSEKETCTSDNSYLNEPLANNDNHDHNKVSVLIPKEKVSCHKIKTTETTSPVITKNKENNKAPKKGKTSSDELKNHEKTNSVFSLNKGINKTSTTQQTKNTIDKYNNEEKVKSSKKLKPNTRCSKNKVIPAKQNENLIIHEKCIKDNSSMSKKIDTNSDAEIQSQEAKCIAREKSSDRKCRSCKKQNDNLKDCSVVLTRGKSEVKEKSADSFKADLLPKNFVGTTPSPEQVMSHEMETFSGDFADSQIGSNGQKCVEQSITYQNKKSLEKVKNDSKEILNCDNDKIKDLVLRMKSLSKSEALKVITEFASTLKLDDSQENVHVSKDQRVPSKEEEIGQPDQIKVKDEVIDDFSEPLIIENNINNQHPIKKPVNNKTAEAVFYSSAKNGSVTSTSVHKQHQLFTQESKELKIKFELQDNGAIVNNKMPDLQNCHASMRVVELSSEQLAKNAIADSTIQKDQSEKYKFIKKKKLSELEKIHADLESCRGLDDIMKCSGLRACRLKNEVGGPLKENITEDKQLKKRAVALCPDESFFIEDEITIKMEPIPELTFDIIKQEPEYF